MFLWSSDAAEGSFFSHFLSSAMADERFIYIFYLPPRRKNFFFTFFIFRHGGRTFLSHFLSSATAEERSFLILLSSAMAEEHFFLFSVHPTRRKVVF